jgi:ATP-dependent Lhr-like helicase
VLAQQIVAMVSVEPWSPAALFDRVRQAYPYLDLSRPAFDSVLDMLSGAYQRLGGPGHVSLRAKIAWDRINDRLAALPGSRMLASGNPGVIPDTGAYDVYLPDGKTKVGTLDEEFIFETRVGDVFLLGSSTWRVQEITDDRVVVGDAAGVTPRMPFWRGDYPWRPYELGARIGRLRREVAEKLARDEGRVTGDGSSGSWADGPQAALLSWLRADYALDERSARHLVGYVQGQIDAIGAFSSDRTIVVEQFTDSVGDPRMVVHSPFGGRVNGAWALALSDALRERYGMEVETQVDDDGILVRLPQSGGPSPVDLVREMTFAEARERLLRELPNSALFGAHFRMNAGRALLLPKTRGRKRTPFWLQRLKAKDLLATVLQVDDFPLVTETVRDCLRDVLDMPHLQEVLDGIRDGRIQLVPVETIVPSPVAAGLLFSFISVYMYEWDAPKAERQLQQLALAGDALDDLLRGAQAGARPLPEALAESVGRAAHSGPTDAARSPEELAVFLAELGDLTREEALSRCGGDGAAWLAHLAREGRIVELPIPAASGPERRLVAAELAGEYADAFASSSGPMTGSATTETRSGAAPSSLAILRRWLRHAGPVTRAGILDRYAFPPEWLDETLSHLVAAREVVQGHFVAAGAPPAGRDEAQPTDRSAGLQFCDRHLFEQIQRGALARLRREVQPVPLTAYADFLLRWQGLGRDRGNREGPTLPEVMEQLRGAALAGTIWERDVLPARVAGFRSDDLAALCESGEWVWSVSGQDPRRAGVRFFRRGEGRLFLEPPGASESSGTARRVLDFLGHEGASFLVDLQGGLGLGAVELADALVELALAGRVTNDTLAALHALFSHRGEAETPRSPVSSLEAELADRIGPRLVAGQASRGRYHAAKRRVSQRLRSQEPEQSIGFWRGRWALLHRSGILGPARTEADVARAQAQVLLARFGIVTRETLAFEPGPWSWESLYNQLGRMELRGEVRRGYFVAGLPGVQFALPEAVEALRAARARLDSAATEDEAPVVINATDPSNIYGAEGRQAAAGLAPTFARLPSTHLVLWRGQPILVAEDHGAQWMAAEVPTDALASGLRAYLARPNAPRRMTAYTWNGMPVLDSPGCALLQAHGFSRTPSGLERWA